MNKMLDLFGDMPTQKAVKLPVADNMTVDELVVFLTKANAQYRQGSPLVHDDVYDHVYLARLRELSPTHPYLTSIEVENDYGEGKIKHLTPMLSTDKAYTEEEVSRFVDRVLSIAGGEKVEFSIAPKLDGIAAKLDGGVVATRGNGLVGNDITHILSLGIKVVGGDSGAGEIVIDQQYFDSNLKDHFDHPRNFIAGLVSAKTISPHAEKALKDGAVHLVLFSGLDSITASAEELKSSVESICQTAEDNCSYLTDGAVISVKNNNVIAKMGSTSHHNRWQIAKKLQGEVADTVIQSIVWQVGRTGRITPVLDVTPTYLSGASISRVSAHHAGNVVANGLSKGTKISIIRSGEVIPKILSVTEASGSEAVIPPTCPCCNSQTVLEGGFLYCHSESCPAKIESRLLHYFEILGNIDLFGSKTISKLVASGFDDLVAIYTMTTQDFINVGFGEKQANNLVEQLARSKTDAVENWRFLAAMGIHHLGRGDSRKLLRHFDITQIRDLTEDDILTIKGFGEITAREIPIGIEEVWPVISGLLALGFNLQSERSVKAEDSPITDKNIVFTGSMSSSRDEMKDTARRKGAHVQSSVNKKTDYLVIGEKVGAKKIEKAESLGTKVISEAEYLTLIG